MVCKNWDPMTVLFSIKVFNSGGYSFSYFPGGLVEVHPRLDMESGKTEIICDKVEVTL